MNNNEFLDEEKYEKVKNKITRISLVILILGILIGGGLIASGFVKKNELKKEKEREIIEEKKADEKTNEEQTSRINELNQLIKETEEKLDQESVLLVKLQNEKSKIFSQDRGFSDRYYKKDEEIKTKQNVIAKLNSTLSGYKSELSRLKFNQETSNLMGNNYKVNIDESLYVPRFMFGAFILIASCMISLFIYFISKRREIMAFSAQQTMPIAKEQMEKMSDTVSKISGDIAREISKGVEEGKASANVAHVVRCPHCGADNEIIGKTGKCEYCKSKISYKE